MSRINSQRKSCIDVFNAFLVAFATYAGLFEFPIIKPTYDIPNRLIAFSKAISCPTGQILFKEVSFVGRQKRLLCW